MKRKLLLLWLIWGIIPLGNAVLPDGCSIGSSLYAQTDESGTAPSPPDFWEQLRALLQKKEQPENARVSVTEKYSAYYDWIHGEETQFYDSLSKLGVVNWDKYQNIIRVDTKVSKDSILTNKLARNIRVFGWYPYWMGNAYESFHFNLLSHVALFCYNIEPATGECTSPDVIKQWMASKPLIELAHKDGCKVLLTIASHTEKGNFIFLKDTVSQRNLIANLIDLLKQLKGDGVDVNFENVPNGLQTEMTAFLKTLSRELKKHVPEPVLTVDLPSADKYGTYELHKLDSTVTLYLVTGYDYAHAKSKVDGPVAPLDVTAGTYSIVESVRRYLLNGMKREKLVLGLPYYGAVWTAQSPRAGQPDTTLRFSRHITYRELKARYCTEEPGYDLQRWSGYYVQYNKDSSYYEKCWFDDTLTLGRKMDWILQERLAGMGIWALGYDNGRTELWEMLNAKFVSDTTLVYTEPIVKSRYYNLSRSLLEFRPLIAIAGIFMVVFLLAGLMVALFDWQVREVFFQNKTLRLLYAFAGIAIILSILAFYQYVEEKPLLDNNVLAIGLGLAAGVCLTLYVNYRYEKSIKNLP